MLEPWDNLCYGSKFPHHSDRGMFVVPKTNSGFTPHFSLKGTGSKAHNTGRIEGEFRIAYGDRHWRDLSSPQHLPEPREDLAIPFPTGTPHMLES